MSYDSTLTPVNTLPSQLTAKRREKGRTKRQAASRRRLDHLVKLGVAILQRCNIGGMSPDSWVISEAELIFKKAVKRLTLAK